MPRSSYICRFRLDGTQKKSHEFLQFNNPIGLVPGSMEGLSYERVVPLQIATGTTYYLQPYQHVGVLGLFNNGGSGLVLNLERVEVFPMNPPVAWALGTCGLAYLIYRNSGSFSGGSPVAVTKSDTASPDLPAGISVLNNASFLGMGNSVRNFLDGAWTSYTPAGAAGRVATMLANYRGVAGNGRCNLSTGEVWDCGVGEQRVQRLRVHPGEQFAIGMWSGSPPAYFPYAAVLLNLTFLIGPDTYHASVWVPAFNPMSPVVVCPIAIVNDSVATDVEIVRVSLQEPTDTDYPFWTLSFVDGVEGGDNAEVEKLDSANADLPGSILVRRDTNIMRPGAKRGASAGGINIREILHSNVGVWPTTTPFVNDKFYNFGRYASFSGSLALREGQGIALVQRNQSGIGQFEVYFRFSVSSAHETQGGSVYVS